MKAKYTITAALVLLLQAAVSADVIFDVMQIGSDQWQYSYTVQNPDSAFVIEEFTVFFGADLYDNISIEGIQPPSPEWDVLVWNSAFAGSPGGYDALSTGSGISQGQAVSGFLVTFDWLGSGLPGSQYYEVVNPLNYSQILESGWTTSAVIPAPSALALAVSGLAFLKMRSWK